MQSYGFASFSCWSVCFWYFQESAGRLGQGVGRAPEGLCSASHQRGRQASHGSRQPGQLLPTAGGVSLGSRHWHKGPLISVVVSIAEVRDKVSSFGIGVLQDGLGFSFSLETRAKPVSLLPWASSTHAFPARGRHLGVALGEAGQGLSCFQQAVSSWPRPPHGLLPCPLSPVPSLSSWALTGRTSWPTACGLSASARSTWSAPPWTG